MRRVLNEIINESRKERGKRIIGACKITYTGSPPRLPITDIDFASFLYDMMSENRYIFEKLTRPVLFPFQTTYVFYQQCRRVFCYISVIFCSG